MNKLTQIIKETSTWNSEEIIVYIDNFHHPFFQTPSKYILPSISIHGLNENSAEKYLQEIKTFLPKEIKNFCVLPLGIFKREPSKLVLALDLEFDGYKFIYLIKFECKHLGGVNNKDVIHSATQEYGISCYTNKVYYNQSILPVQSIHKKKKQILSFEILPFAKSIFEKILNSPKKKFVSELFDEIDYSHLMDEINEKIEFKKYWEIGKIYSPLKIEHLSLSVHFLSWDILKNIKWFKKFFPVLLGILNFQEIEESYRSEFLKWLKTHTSERTLSNSGNPTWKINFANY